MGTFNFMSPEAIEDQGDSEDNRPSIKISRKSDVWSLGCILYQLTYGKLPFRDFRNPIKKLDAIINPNYQVRHCSLKIPALLFHYCPHLPPLFTPIRSPSLKMVTIRF